MRTTFLIFVLVAVAAMFGPQALALTISVGNDPGATATDSLVDGDQANGFELNATVDFDPQAGFWFKSFRNTGGSPIASGVDVQIVENITNEGNESWTDWHEEIFGGGFLFRQNMVDVYLNGTLLVEGTDYSLVATPTLLGGLNAGNWEAIDLFFNAPNLVDPSDVLRIEKKVFEVFLDGNVWQPNEIAHIRQYPTVPEPSAMLLALIALAGVAGLRRAGA